MRVAFYPSDPIFYSVSMIYLTREEVEEAFMVSRVSDIMEVRRRKKT